LARVLAVASKLSSEDADILAWTGSLGETCAIQWDDFDMAGRFLRYAGRSAYELGAYS
jgi:hypothetical protein